MRGLAVVVCVSLTSVAGAQPADFIAQAKALHRVAACGSDDPVPARFDPHSIDRHCKTMTKTYAEHRKKWADKAQAFLREIRPKDAPSVVVYPFGGGDLSSALVTFPDATEITTISLEAAGDVRAIDSIRQATLSHDLSVVSSNIRALYWRAFSATEHLQKASRKATFPGTLMFAFAGMALHDMEPVSLRYFDLAVDGSISYLTAEELDRRAAEYAATKREKLRPKKVTHYWYAHDSAFGNVEIRFRKRGDAKAAVRTYRHIVQNLDDPHLAGDGRLLAHLRAKGKVSAMTKAASFLLWYDDFSLVRGYLANHIAWMVSDASGIPPVHAANANLEQVTYGEFAGPLFTIDPKGVRKQFIKLWKEQPRRKLGFRYGYPDVHKRAHLLVTRPRNAKVP